MPHTRQGLFTHASRLSKNMVTSLRIGNLTIKGPLILAPMAKFTHSPIRCLCKEFGANLVYCEFVMAKDVVKGDRRALGMLRFRPEERPIIGQICSADPSEAASAAKSLESMGFDGVDLNLDCQVNRVLAMGAGGALHSEPARAEQIFRAMRNSVKLPLTVKMRSGIDPEHINAVEIARIAQDSGFDAVAVHGRTVKQGYKGDADWKIIAAVKEAVRIPVMGSGGVRTARDVIAMRDSTGCDGVMIARGALGYPWIFREAYALIHTGHMPPPPSNNERLRVLMHTQDLLTKHFGEAKTLRFMPQWICYYASSLPGYEKLLQNVHKARNLKALAALAKEHFTRNF